MVQMVSRLSQKGWDKWKYNKKSFVTQGFLVNVINLAPKAQIFGSRSECFLGNLENLSNYYLPEHFCWANSIQAKTFKFDSYNIR